MIDQIILSITQYFYIEYVFAVLVLTACVRGFFPGINTAIHPKWITLYVGVLLGVVGYVLKIFSDQQFHIFKVITSFGAATLGYDYFWKVLKDRLTK